MHFYLLGFRTYITCTCSTAQLSIFSDKISYLYSKLKSSACLRQSDEATSLRRMGKRTLNPLVKNVSAQVEKCSFEQPFFLTGVPLLYLKKVSKKCQSLLVNLVRVDLLLSCKPLATLIMTPKMRFKPLLIQYLQPDERISNP